jgi:HD-GYP domain-containing protein (c-di-GMP phosphodiesterase class II)/DNA-binding CsgD family transcriptional regulator
VRQEDIVLALSLAVDLGMGRPLEHGMRSAILSVAFARKLGHDDAVARESWFFVLLRLLGCTSDQRDLAHVLGADELVAGAAINQSDWTDPLSMVRAVLVEVTRGKAGLEALQAVVRTLPKTGMIAESHLNHCEVATTLARDLRLDESVITAIGQAGEAWNGKGGPYHLKGDAIRPSVQLASLIEDFDTFQEQLGFDRALALVKTRRGKIYGPRVLDAWLGCARALYDAVPRGSLWDAALAALPAGAQEPEVPLDTQLEVLADFTDLKGTHTRGHARAVAALAEKAAAAMGLPEAERTLCRRAGLIHDLGVAAVSAHLWDKPGPFTDSEAERMRLHAYYTQRIAARPEALRAIADVAVLSHERVDGQGYPQRAQGTQLPMTARLIAAADVWSALVSARPHRPAYEEEDARRLLLEEVKSGHLDQAAADAVLSGAGLAVKAPKGEPPKSLTEREVEVLRLVSLGKTNKEIAQKLGTSPKTVDNQLQSIFKKLGVQTRGAATLWAMRSGLLG